MLRKKKVLIVVDNPTRDLNASILLASQLLQHQFDVFLTPLNQLVSDTFKLLPDHVILNYLRENNQRYVKQLLKNRISWSVLDTEGAVFANINNGKTNSYTTSIIKDEELRRKTLLFFVWGTDLLKTLKAQSFYSHASLKLTGSPRIDLLHPKYRPLVEERKSDFPNGYILINTSFSLINPKFQSSEREQSELINKFGYEPGFLSKLVQSEKEAMERYISLTEELCLKLPETQFVLRPHPFESLEPYRRALGRFTNLTIKCEGPIEQWLSNAKAVIHYECSTAIEAALINKPVLSLREEMSLRSVKEAKRVTHFVADSSEMVSAIRKIQSGDLGFEKKSEREQVIESLYYKFDGESNKRIGEEISRAVSRVSIPFWKSAYLYLIYSARALAKLAMQGSWVPASKRFSCEQVQRVLDQLNKINQAPLKADRVFNTRSIQILKSN